MSREEAPVLPLYVSQVRISAMSLKFLCCCAPGYEHDDTVLEG
ncbi:MAG: hypothetical protein V3R99_04430 [Thermoguttaceae bacterium]